MDDKKSLEKRKCTTPKFRASYANVFKPSKIDEKSDPKFNITMLFDEDDDLSALRKAAHYAAVEKWGKDKAAWPKKRRMPFRKGNEDKPDDKTYKDKIFVYASSKEESPPGVYDQRKKAITEESGDFYSGCYARAVLIAFHYKKAGNEGISFALRNVQKWEDGEKLSGNKGAADFDDALGNEIEDMEEFDEDEMGDDFLD